ncbi:hypothetical protein KDW_08610 [Dictyobacter vulcani]|uniref:histidine kinase n=1 Tax=Dictyobacter vulcani TaxID=2607529 RepID=A0A5J4KKN5_9CHLR|nr:PAS domain-containing sensor histidine kinase [Dictyobacter vulcani]GER86699.1 hypothetical protein KDW_08610 [Dictyobacter vulcani]
MASRAKKITCADVTESQKAGEALRQREEELEIIFNNATFGIALIDDQGHFLRINPVYYTLSGYNKEELSENNFFQIIHPDDHTQLLQLIQEMTAGKTSSGAIQQRYLSKDGKVIWVQNSISIVKDEHNNIHYFIVVSEPVPYRQQIDEKAILAAIVDSSDDAIISKTLDSIIMSWNHAAEEMFGYTAEEAIGQPITIIVPPELQHEEPEIIQKLRMGIRIRHYETVRVRKDKSRLDVSLSISPVKNSEGKIIGGAKIARDISEQKAAERQKDEFISMASHELKTPITSLKGFTQVLLRRFKQQHNEDAIHLISRMNRQVDRITKLINEMLDVSIIETGQLEYHKEIFALDALVQEIVETVQETTLTHHIVIEHLECVQVFGDKDRIGQVIMNLLTNAIKYSPHANQANIRVEIDSEKKNAIIRVQDFGLGIAKAHQQKIFQRFYRVSEQKNQTLTGLGIGLYICEEIIKRHAGSITIESKEGKGSTFSVILPIAEIE